MGMDKDQILFVGTYTQKMLHNETTNSQGIYSLGFNSSEGKLSPLSSIGNVKNPSFLTLSKSKRFLFAVSELSEFKDEYGGGVSSFEINPTTGEFSFINSVSSKGIDPCHLIVDNTDNYVLVANYGSGSVIVLPFNDEGILQEQTCFIQHAGSSVNPDRQQGPHAHSVSLDDQTGNVFVADLGQDRLVGYILDSVSGCLNKNQVSDFVGIPGSGPRHFDFHPSKQFAFLINELDSTITSFSYDQTLGSLSEISSVSTLPKGFSGQNTTADIHVAPNGRFLYGSNRGHDSIAIFEINPVSGSLTSIGHEFIRGSTPRNFVIHPSGNHLLVANQSTDNIVVFDVNEDGTLNFSGQDYKIPSPVCLKFV